MQILMPTILFIGLTNVMGIQVMVPLGKEKWVLYSVTIGALVDLTINALLIPKMASSGAAIGTLVAEIVVLIYQYGKLKDRMKGIFAEVRWMSLILAGVIAGAGSVCIKFFSFNTFISLVVSAVIYFGAYGSILLITGEPLVKEIVQQIITKLISGKEK